LGRSDTRKAKRVSSPSRYFYIAREERAIEIIFFRTESGEPGEETGYHAESAAEIGDDARKKYTVEKSFRRLGENDRVALSCYLSFPLWA
jgi:hypothetical protein